MDMESGAAVTSSALVTCFWWSSLTEPGQDCPKYRQRSHQLVCTNTDVSTFLHIGGKICVGGARDEYERDHRHIYGVRRNFQNTETLGLIRPQYKSWCIKRMITCPLGWRALSSPQIYHDFLRAAYTSCPFYCFSPLPLSPLVSATIHLVGKMTEMHPPLSLPSLSIPRKDHL